MMQILMNLEPRYEEQGTQLFQELDEFNDIIFV